MRISDWSSDVCSSDLADIAASIARHTPGDGFPATPLERLSLVRSSTPTMPMPNVYRQLLCLVAQGSKHVVLGDRVFTYRSEGSRVVKECDSTCRSRW